jgi:hypothetical protein
MKFTIIVCLAFGALACAPSYSFGQDQGCSWRSYRGTGQSSEFKLALEMAWNAWLKRVQKRARLPSDARWRPSVEAEDPNVQCIESVRKTIPDDPLFDDEDVICVVSARPCRRLAIGHP